jgi:hypothetical protein
VVGENEQWWLKKRRWAFETESGVENDWVGAETGSGRLKMSCVGENEREGEKRAVVG